MIAKSELAKLVKDALRNLYTPAHLQNHPLLALLSLDREAGETSGEALRRLLREAIEMLRPGCGSPPRDSEELGYEVLRLRYLCSLSQEEVCAELGISSSTFFRTQRGALDAIVSLLMERGLEEHAEANPVAAGSPEEALVRAAALVSDSPSQVSDAGTLLNDVVQTAQALADQYRVPIHAEVLDTIGAVCGQLPVLRQLLLMLVVDSLQHISGPALCLSASAQEREVVWSVGPVSTSILDSLWGRRPTAAACRRLVDLCSGRLELDQSDPERAVVTLTIPALSARIVLVIDDDPDAIALYRRLLVFHNAALLDARSAEQARVILGRAIPDLVLLDVILPGEDGWTILRELKDSPETADVPVVVCSAIEQPNLALALGATEVLRKPVALSDLAAALGRVL